MGINYSIIRNTYSLNRKHILTGVNMMIDDNKLDDYKEFYEELKLILDLSFDQITIADGEGIFTRVSKSCESYFGIKESELIGANAFELEKQGVFDMSVTAEVLRKNEKVTIIQKTRANKILMVTGIPIYNDDKKITKIINISKDITKNTVLSKQLSDVEEELKWVKKELIKRSAETKSKVIYNSVAMNKTMDLIYHIADSDATVLLLGETGVGKGYIAKIIHEISFRNKKPFVTINCGAIPENLLESELFGYEPGAFSGASKNGKKGLFEIAGEGTIFLDEIGDMSINLQVKLLHVLDGKKIFRVGGEKPIDVHGRIIAATNKDLEKLIKEGEFRKDLYYRLNVIPMNVPALKDRKEDIPALIKHFIDNFKEEYGIEKTISESGYKTLINYNYPGNIRQLENMIERLVITTPGNIIDKSQIEDIMDPQEKLCFDHDEIIPIKRAVKELERKILISAFEKYKTTRKVAQALEIDQSTVVKKAKALGINYK